MMGGAMGGAMGWMWIWPVLVVLGLFAVVGGLLWWVRARRETPAGASGSARRILDERLARGEIDEDEYRRRRTELQ
ncbi:putative membrane protein [Amycolatopsis echigonensis]|uniref:Membrane protein n=1 Tax=Amycolatopsis echigonensis TaxID=2576905 RepID=A0A2N3WF48_9PSEU|nr:MULTISPECIES: SHOCT domain-containing protein [Amycolatopsis]PKV92514.1 putative membrane protein [Amycolatopsis niigatensis]